MKWFLDNLDFSLFCSLLRKECPGNSIFHQRKRHDLYPVLPCKILWILFILCSLSIPPISVYYKLSKERTALYTMSDGLLVVVFLPFNKIPGFNRDHSRETREKWEYWIWIIQIIIFEDFFVQEDVLKFWNLCYYSLWSYFMPNTWFLANHDKYKNIINMIIWQWSYRVQNLNEYFPWH